MKESKVKTLASNRQAYHEYFIEEKFEAGIELIGTEVKSVRAGKLNLKDSWIDIEAGQMYVKQLHISPYEQGNIFNKDPMRVRRLLMHKREINKLFGLVQRDGYALIPLSVYFKGSRIKVEVALAKGKKLYDKRASNAERDAKREIARELKERNRI
ncbi:MAG: SsrA-binding protein SmpB [Ruminococcaceae bacterium]|nr:SsrA-binding protein SmpB [Oscillospiraceae bacterium]